MQRWAFVLGVLLTVASCSDDESSGTTTTAAAVGGQGGTGTAVATGGTGGTGTAVGGFGQGGTASVSHGDTYVIQGAGFGTKTAAAPFVWDDFEAGSDGTAIDGAAPVHGAAWSGWSSGGVDPVYEASELRHGRSSRHALHDLDSVSQYNCSLSQSLPAVPGDRIYLSYWWRYEATGTEWTNNLKPWVIYTSGGQSVLYVGMSVPGDDLRSGGDADSPTLWGALSQETADGQWIRWEEEILVSQASQADGARHCRVHLSSPASIVTQWSSDAHQTHAGSDWDNIDLGTYQTQDSRSPGARCLFRIDDVYIDRTWARVELGDAADFDSCTRREVQVPSAWSDTEITITVNQGALPSLAGLYLFVIDDAGQVAHSQPL
ncbi:MAG: hypothetical protein JRI23_29170 [Deltaproteobacteria bacterium]|nr:hypothetical protein [Deltaproteobacteria bacterium]MBW2536210.1 hypothetical protein [Deltaproteobacteria bacterium]